ncbi:chromosome partition protein MukF [Oceanisphaera pacifica]|uniref:Chromosome partition protein MukF n=1 Tax=Oceanisphaera pacifica TaxID=2818389 RepID=A0ABS3NEJ5_9GAMM|nr:chromosome partition protein MukF [Oceanisphaera pacifica]MBO1518715.1 chromosome partition protein MukF [Oceanisphaera pacifica]
MTQMSRTLPDWIGWVQEEQCQLNLPPERLAFLLAIHIFGKEGEQAQLSEAELQHGFRFVSQGFNQAEDTLVSRANNAINDLVRQRLLSRFQNDAGEGDSLYRLTRLGVAIVEFFAAQRDVSQIKLSLQLEQISQDLNKIADTIAADPNDQQWQQEVAGRLTYSVADQLARIDDTQRAMDEQQNAVKANIAALLNKNWHEAITACEQLLRETGHTLRELQDTLDNAGHGLQLSLLTIEELLQQQTRGLELAPLCQQLQARLDAITLWGSQCIELWARYDLHVHRFIRTAIDMDKNRAFSQRLRESIRQFEQHNWQLRLAQAQPLLELRAETLAAYAEEVTGAIPNELEYQEMVDVSTELSQRIQVYLQDFANTDQPLDIAAVLKTYLEDFPHYQHFDIARLLIDEAVKLGHANLECLGAAQPDWQRINAHGAEVQAHVIDQY